jgi:hypothetical protein
MMEMPRPTARQTAFTRLAEHLATAQDMADSGSYGEAFGYLEEAVKIALAHVEIPEVATRGGPRDEAVNERLVSYDSADVWRGVESHPLFPLGR